MKHKKTIILLVSFLTMILGAKTGNSETWLDFAHPATPHLDLTNPNLYLSVDELMTNSDVYKELPVLVVLLEFDDCASLPQHNPAYYADMVFGQNRSNGLPSVAEVYDRLSNGRLKVVPAVDGDRHDGVSDGIVGWETAQSQAGCCKNGSDPIKLDVESCILQGHTWLPGSKEYYGCWIKEKRAEGIRQADSLFDYWYYNGSDTLITGDELGIIVINADPSSAHSGNSRVTDPAMVEVESGPDPLWVYQYVTGVAEGPEVSLLAHELGHSSLGMGDLYPACNTSTYRQPNGYMCDTNDDSVPDVHYPPDPSWYSLMTWSTASFVQQYLDPWHALHLGFTRAQIVDRDGHYTLYDVETNRTFSQQASQPETLLIYDPLRPSPYNDYYLLENRNMTVKNSANLDQTDRGLTIWKIEDDGDTNRRKAMLVRRGGYWASTVSDTTWDGSSSSTTYDFGPDSSPRNTNWADGTKSYIEIYDISKAGTSMTFNVRMPPLFVDLNSSMPIETGYRDFPFDTLPEALTAVSIPPRTIRIAGGNYSEPITINTPVTLMQWKNGDVVLGASSP